MGTTTQGWNRGEGAHQTLVFSVVFGLLKAVFLLHSNRWFVDQVVVQNMATKKQWTYRVHRWFDKEFDDGAISRRCETVFHG